MSLNFFYCLHSKNPGIFSFKMFHNAALLAPVFAGNEKQTSKCSIQMFFSYKCQTGGFSIVPDWCNGLS